MKCRTVMVALVAVALLTTGWTAEASLNQGYQSVVLFSFAGNPVGNWVRLLPNGSWGGTFEIPSGKILIITEMDVSISETQYEAYAGGTCFIVFDDPDDNKIAFFTKIKEPMFNVNMTTGVGVTKGANFGVHFRVPPNSTAPPQVPLGTFMVVLRGYLMPYISPPSGLTRIPATP